MHIFKQTIIELFLRDNLQSKEVFENIDCIWKCLFASFIYMREKKQACDRPQFFRTFPDDNLHQLTSISWLIKKFESNFDFPSRSNISALIKPRPWRQRERHQDWCNVCKRAL